MEIDLRKKEKNRRRIEKEVLLEEFVWMSEKKRRRRNGNFRSEDDDLLRRVETPTIVRKWSLSIEIFDFWLFFAQRASRKCHLEGNGWRAVPEHRERKSSYDSSGAHFETKTDHKEEELHKGKNHKKEVTALKLKFVSI
jgi:hypothetical protein